MNERLMTLKDMEYIEWTQRRLRTGKHFTWSFNRLMGDGSEWVPRWGTKYAAELINLIDTGPRKGRTFSTDGTTATNLHKGGYIKKVKGGFILTEKGCQYLRNNSK